MMAALLASPRAKCYFGYKRDNENLCAFSFFLAPLREMYSVLAKAQRKTEAAKKN